MSRLFGRTGFERHALLRRRMHACTWRTLGAKDFDIHFGTSGYTFIFIIELYIREGKNPSIRTFGGVVRFAAEKVSLCVRGE